MEKKRAIKKKLDMDTNLFYSLISCKCVTSQPNESLGCVKKDNMVNFMLNNTVWDCS